MCLTHKCNNKHAVGIKRNNKDWEEVNSDNLYNYSTIRSSRSQNDIRTITIKFRIR